MFEAPLKEAPLIGRAKRARPADPHLYGHMPYVLEVRDDVVRTRENALMLSMEVAGIDGFTSSEADIDALRQQFASVLDGLDERFTIYIHRMMRTAEFGLRPIYGESFAADVDRRWQEHLAGQDLKEFVVVLSIVRSLQAPLKVPFFAKAAKKLFDGDTTERMAELIEVAAILEGSLGVRMRRLKISDGSLIGFYSALNTGVLRSEYRGSKTLIAEDVASVGMRFQGSTAEIEEGLDSPRFAAVLVVKAYPQLTWAGMLDALDSSADTVICHSYTPIAMAKISERAKLRIQQMRGAGDLAATVEAQLFEAADAVESGRLGYGDHQFSISVFAESLAELDDRVSRIRGAAEQAKVRLIRASHSMEASFFATHPGNMDYRCWSMTVSSMNFADMASLHMSDAGERAASLPWRTPITVLKTTSGAAHRFSFHAPGDPEAEPTLAHTLVLGPSYSGKTTTVGFLVAQAQRAGIRTIFFDKDRGLHSTVAALGGRYASIRAGQPTGLNPLATEAGERGEAWLVDWLASLLERNGPTLTPLQSESLKSAVRQNQMAGADLRCFRHFQALIGDIGDGRDLARRLAEWGPEGRYAWAFGEADHPIIDLNAASILGIDMTEILDLPTERTAVLSYLFRRLEMMFEDRVPTMVVIDEASTVLDDSYFAGRIPKWLATVRKLNVAMVLMTQFPSQIRNSRAKSILEGLPNRLIFPNNRATEEDYDGYGLTEGQMSFILSTSKSKRRALWNGPTGSTVLNVDLSPLGSMLTALGGGEAATRAFGENFENKPFFWRFNDHA